MEGGYFRVHLHPKRFPAAHRGDWPARIVRDAAAWVAVNKPPGLQVPPTVDNVRESLLACVEQVRRHPSQHCADQNSTELHSTAQRSVFVWASSAAHAPQTSGSAGACPST